MDMTEGTLDMDKKVTKALAVLQGAHGFGSFPIKTGTSSQVVSRLPAGWKRALRGFSGMGAILGNTTPEGSGLAWNAREAMHFVRELERVLLLYPKQDPASASDEVAYDMCYNLHIVYGYFGSIFGSGSEGRWLDLLSLEQFERMKIAFFEGNALYDERVERGYPVYGLCIEFGEAIIGRSRLIDALDELWETTQHQRIVF